jgi:hypothetical protein
MSTKMATSSLEETLARLRAIQASPRTSGWDSRARADAINTFVDFHYGTHRKGNLTEAFVAILIKAIEHELKTSGRVIEFNRETPQP